MLPRSIFKKCPACGIIDSWDEKGEWYVGVPPTMTSEQEVAYALAGILQLRTCVYCWQREEAFRLYAQLRHLRAGVPSK